MRKLTKSEEPTALATNATTWRVEFVEYVENNGGVVGRDAPRRYQHPDIKVALEEEMHEKCAYCESRITHVTFSHIEHILPKSKRPDLVVTWGNLTLACPLCNQRKGDYHDDAAPLVDPYADDPETEILFFGPMAHADGTGAGFRTIRQCALNRTALLFARTEVLERVESLARHAQSLPEGAAKEFVLVEARGLGDEAAEFTAAVRTHLTVLGI